MQKIADSPRKVITIRPTESILKARALMTMHGIRHLPVVDETRHLLGIVSDRDLRSAIPYRLMQLEDAELQKQKPARMLVREIMTPDPHTISTTDTLQDALLMFQRTDVGAFPVVDGDRKVVGIVSYRDVLNLFIDFLGGAQPGSFLAVRMTDTTGTIRQLVDAISRAGISMASFLAVPPRDAKDGAVIAYLLTKDTGRVRRIVEQMGLTVMQPLQWFLGQFQGQCRGVKRIT